MTTHWTPQEDNRLLFFVGVEPPSSIAARLGRTERSVIVRYRRKYKKTLTRAAAMATGLSIADCAHALGVQKRRVFDWIDHGWLKARKRYVIRDYVYTVKEEDFTLFLTTIGGLLPQLRPAPEWADEVAQARKLLHARYIDRAGISDVLGMAPRRLPSNAGFPDPAITLLRYWYERAAVREWLRTAPAQYRSRRALRAFGLEDS